MSTYFSIFDTTPANLAADLRGAILNSTDWSRPNSGSLPNLVKATTAAGAQMAIQLDDAAVTSKLMQMGIYRTHDGTTGVDKITRYLMWRSSVTGATSDPVRVTLSVGPEHLFFSVEGPQAGQTSPEDATNGSYKQALFLGAVTPYFAADSVPCVVCVGVETTNTRTSVLANVSRNQAGSSSWVAARLLSMQQPAATSTQVYTEINAVTRLASDGSKYLFPYVVVEDTAGLRGRIAKLHFAGFNTDGTNSSITDPIPSPFEKISYGGDTYILVTPTKAITTSNGVYQAFGVAGSATSITTAPVIAVPYSTP